MGLETHAASLEIPEVALNVFGDIQKRPPILAEIDYPTLLTETQSKLQAGIRPAPVEIAGKSNDPGH